MSHSAILLVKGNFRQIYSGVKVHHNRHRLQGSRMFETDCDCRLRIQYLKDAKHVKELYRIVRKQLRIINIRRQLRYPLCLRADRNAIHLERRHAFRLKEDATYAKYYEFQNATLVIFLLEYVD